MLCDFGELRNGSVVNHFIHLNRTATSIATGKYITVQESIGQKGEPASRNEKGKRNTPLYVYKRSTVKAYKEF